jgi:hypothetical protein
MTPEEEEMVSVALLTERRQHNRDAVVMRGCSDRQEATVSVPLASSRRGEASEPAYDTGKGVRN